MTREELIAALETTTGPDRLSDAAIARSQGWVERERVYGSGWETPTGRFVSWHELPRYTASIDAALTLVPEGWRWSLDWTQRSGYQDCGRADLYAPGSGIQPPDVCDVYAATPAIALCIAALKAQGGGA